MAKGSTKKENTSTNTDTQDVSEEVKAATTPAPAIVKNVLGYEDEEEGEETLHLAIKNQNGTIEFDIATSITAEIPDSMILISTKIMSATVDYEFGADQTIGTGNVSEQDVWYLVADAHSLEGHVPANQQGYSETEADLISSVAGYSDAVSPQAAVDARIASLLSVISIEETPLKSFNRIITKGKL